MRAKPLFTVMLITYLPSLELSSNVENTAPGATGSVLKLTVWFFFEHVLLHLSAVIGEDLILGSYSF